MYKPSAVFTSQLSPQRKLALKVKKPVIKVTTTLQKSYQHKYNNSEIVTPKYPNPIIMAKAPATTTAKRARDVPKLLFAKVKQEQDYQLTTTRAKRHKYVLSENMAQFSYNFPVPKPRDSKLSKQMSSPQKFMENLSSTESLLKAFTPRGSVDEEKKNLWQTLKYPTTPSAVLKLCMHRMNHFEQAEILNYPQIYFIGNSLMNCKEPINKNYGYDDDKGDYKIVIGDHIAYRYEIVSMLGRGSFGQVVKAMDHKTKLEVALKVIRNKARFHEQAMVEIDVLKYLKEKDPNDSYCVVHLEDHFAFRKHMVSSI